jgi:hypothetical protein
MRKYMICYIWFVMGNEIYLFIFNLKN